MNTTHTSGNWTLEYCLDNSIFVKSGENFISHIETQENSGISDEMNANARLIAAAPELLQMVYDLKKCIERLTSDTNLTQEDKDKEAQWVGEAHELLAVINPNYYNNANELQHQKSNN